MATALRTFVVLLFSWICYFKALSTGNVNKVAPIDKSSTILTVLLAIILFGETDRLAIPFRSCNGRIVVTVLFSYIVFKEKLTRKSFIGLCMMIAGTLAMAIWA